jgi:hypothetical protein
MVRVKREVQNTTYETRRLGMQVEDHPILAAGTVGQESTYQAMWDGVPRTAGSWQDPKRTGVAGVRAAPLESL